MNKIKLTDEEWRQRLTPDEYRILRAKGTELPFTGAYYRTKEDGTYCCKACGAELFRSETKYDSGSGWPSFFDVIDPDAVKLVGDNSLGMRRIEIVCARCESHLGHVFDDGPNPTGQRYCVNSASLQLQPDRIEPPTEQTYET